MRYYSTCYGHLHTMNLRRDQRAPAQKGNEQSATSAERIGLFYVSII